MNIKHPDTIPLAANKTAYLQKTEAVWLVKSGQVEVFYIELDKEGNAKSPRTYFFTAETGDLVFSLQTSKADNQGIVLLAVSNQAELEEIPQTTFYSKIPTHTAWQKSLERWIDHVSEGIKSGNPPRHYQVIEGKQSYQLTKNTIVFPKKGLTWVQLEEGDFYLYGNDKIISKEWLCVPISNKLWLKTGENSSKIQTFSTQDIASTPNLQTTINAFQKYALELIVRQDKVLQLQESQRLKEKMALDEVTMESSLGRLTKILEKEEVDEFLINAVGNPLLAACQIVGEEIGIDIQEPQYTDKEAKSDNPLFVIAKASKVRTRQVILRGKWWTEESGHLIAFMGEEKRPVALIQKSPTQYVVKDPSKKKSQLVTAKIAAEIDPLAYMFFVPFDEKLDTVGKVWKFSIKGLRKELNWILFTAFIGSVLGLFTPILSAVLYDSVIPQADRGFLLEIVGLMIILLLVRTLLNLSKSLLLLRFELKTNLNVQGALMDHLLRLPVSFFQQFTAGDLTNRALSINSIRTMLSSTVLTAVLGGVFSVVNLLLLFYYDSTLAWVGIFLALAAIGFIVFIGLLNLRFSRRIAHLYGEIQGTLFEFISGITKIRVAGAEKRVFGVWAEKFARLKKMGFRLGEQQNYLSAFNTAFPQFTNILFFFFIYYIVTTATTVGNSATFSVGVFMAFVTAFHQFLGSCLNMGHALITTLSIIPIYERVKPLLEAEPESKASSEDPGELSGEIEMNHVHFRYEEDGLLVLNDVSFQIKAGEMVAFVGPSGSGKSTVMRLLLDFEQAEAGSVYYDGLDLNALDSAAVRRQIGVVLQHGSLMAGDIYKNIVGTSKLTLEDAWEAAKMAGLEADIKEMPMGMHTVISEGAGTFSGGQKQRLMIARAIVHKPRILLMDEATSALDNRTQKIVTESLERLQATRIVIAHRLSTIMNADRIYVLEAGEIVQTGTFEELMKKEGLFKELAKRQLS